MSGKVIDFPAELPPRRAFLRPRKPGILRVVEVTSLPPHSVRCPRKGCLGAEMSLLVCAQMHLTAPERCAEVGCKAAAVHADDIAYLKEKAGWPAG